MSTGLMIDSKIFSVSSVLSVVEFGFGQMRIPRFGLQIFLIFLHFFVAMEISAC